MDQKAIVEGVKRGDRDVFRLFMEENIEAVYRIVYKTVSDENEARDIVQETFIKVWEKRKTIRSNSGILNWTKRIALNRCYDYLRWINRNRKNISAVNSVDMKYLPGSDLADDVISREEYKEVLEKLTCKLSPKQRLVFTLYGIENLNHDEISEITGMSKNSIKSNLRHARVKMGENFKKLI